MKKSALIILSLLAVIVAAFGIHVWQDNQRLAPPPLEQAAAKGDTAKVEALLKKGVNVNSRPNQRPPALVAAAKNGKVETVRALVQHGADLRSRNEALAAAVQDCDLAAVQVLLQSGADGQTLLKPDTSGKSPFAQLKERVTDMPSPCKDLLRTLELAGITDKPRPKVKR